MRILDFKTISPLFEWERDGGKPFTDRRWDGKDKRFRALAQFHKDFNWGVRITNPATGDSFVRKLLEWGWIWDGDGILVEPNWVILHLGELLTKEK